MENPRVNTIQQDKIENVAITQQTDQEIQQTIQEIQQGKEVTHKFHKTTKGLYVEQGILMATVDMSPIIVINEEAGKQLAKQIHLSPMTGHGQTENLVMKLKGYVVFLNMTKHVEAVVQTCEPCLAAKRDNNNIRVPMTKTDFPNSIMEILSADLQGPLKTSSGTVYLAYVMDLFSRLIWVGVLKNKNPKLLFEFMMERIFTKHGMMKILLNDPGTDSTSKLTNMLLKRLGGEKKYPIHLLPSIRHGK